MSVRWSRFAMLMDEGRERQRLCLLAEPSLDLNSDPHSSQSEHEKSTDVRETRELEDGAEGERESCAQRAGKEGAALDC